MENDLRPSCRGIAFILILVAVTRLPLLWTGYGSDADAWMVAHAADDLWHTGVYHVSRFPGFPLYEIISAVPVGLGGAILSNGTTLLASLVLLLAMFRLSTRFLRHSGLLILTLAFTPLFWVNSAVTMDYIWSLLFLILSLNSVLKDKVVMGGIWFGIAVGFRLPNLVAVVPIATLLLYEGKSPGRCVSFLASALVVAVLAYLPILLTYGPGGWIKLTQNEMSDIHPSWGQRLKLFCYRSVYAIGPLAVLSFCAIVVINRHVLRQQLAARDPLLVTSIVGMATFLLLFLFFPLERAYLLPAIVFMLIIIGTVSSRSQLLLFGVCSASFAFLNPDLIRHEGVIGTPGPNVHAGMVVEELQNRNRLREDRIRIATLPIEGKALVMTGGGAPFWFQNDFVEFDTSGQWSGMHEQVVRRRTDHDIHFVASLSPNELARVRSMGYTVYCLDSARDFLERTAGISVADEHILVLHR